MEITQEILLKVAEKLINTTDSAESVYEEITGEVTSGYDWDDLLLDHIQNCERCGWWQSIEEFAEGGESGLICDQCLEDE